MMNLWDELEIDDLGTEANQALAETIGMEAAKKLFAAFGGQTIYLAKPESVIRARRDRKIYEEYKQPGVSAYQIAKKYGLTDRQVSSIVREQRARNLGKIRQHEMF